MDEIVNQFQQRYQQLRTMRDAGQLSPQQFIAEVQKLCWQDSSSVWWSINTEGVFLHFDGQKWMPAQPPQITPMPPAQAPAASSLPTQTPLSPAVAPPERISSSGVPVNKRPVKAPERIFRRQAPERISQPSNQSNYHPPPARPLQKQVNKILWVIGSVLSACACVVVVSIVLFTALSQRTKILGQMTVNTGGGTFQDKNVSITISPNPNRSPLTLKITQPRDFSLGLTQTPQIGIEGPLADMNGIMTVTLPIPSGWLTADGKLSEGHNLVVNLEEEAYATSAGTLKSQHPIDSQIDLKTRTVTIEIPLGSVLVISSSVPHDAKPLRQQPANATRIVLKLISIVGLEFTIYGCDDPAKDFHIRGMYSGISSQTPSLSNQDCEKLVNILHDEKKKLEDLGFTDTFRKHARPIQIYLESLGPNRHGQATVGLISSVNNSYLKLNSEELKKGGDMDLSDKNKIRVIQGAIGHEMFHMVQYTYNPLLTKAWLVKGVAGMEQMQLKTLWSDEAMSVWFEPIAVGDSSYIPSIESSNLIDMLQKPLTVPVKDGDSFRKGEGNKGYGTATFLHFLTNKYGNDLVKEILEKQLFVSSAQPVAQVAWDQALRARNGSLSNEYVYFLEGFLIRGQPHTDLYPIFRIENKMETVFVDVKLDPDKMEEIVSAWYAEFTDKVGILIKSSERGYIKAGGTPAHTAIHIPLQNFLFKGVRLIVQKSDIIDTFPGTLIVKISCSGGSLSQACPDSIGLLAYPLQKGDVYVPPSYDGALSWADSYIFADGEVYFLWESDKFADGKPYQGLYLIAFNNRLSTSDDPTTVIIDLYYTWDKQLEAPVPTPEEPQVEPAIPPTDTPVPPPVPPIEEPVIPNQPSEMDPYAACECENRYKEEVYLPYEIGLAKLYHGDVFISMNIEWVTRIYYDPAIDQCMGHYHLVECRTDISPPQCRGIAEMDGRGVKVDEARDRCPGSTPTE